MTPWKVLIVDDEEGIHGITRMIFRGYEFENRPIELISATSSQQAKEILQTQADIALALLDVVMEQDNTGLLLVDHIRNELDNQDIRIILRTGHPGYAPEAQVIVNYDINDYLSKAELSASRLLTSVVVALRSYRDIKSARQHQISTPDKVSTQETSLLPELVTHLQQLILPLTQNSRRLQQLDLNPIAQDLCSNLKGQVSRLEQTLQLLALGQHESPPESFELTALLDEALTAFLPQSRKDGWLIDYQIELENRSISADRAQLLSLLHCALELALLQAQGSDLKLIFRQVLQAERTQLEIRLEQYAGKPVAQKGPWAGFLSEQIQDLCRRQQGILLEAEDSLIVHCLLPVLEVN